MPALGGWALVLLAIAEVASGCAAARPQPATVGQGRETHDALQEQAATLFDAAAHGDELRLKGLVDWTRWRTFAGLGRCSDDAQAAELLSRIEAEPQPSSRFVDAAAHDVRGRLAAVTGGPMPPRPRPGVMNATLAALRGGPPAGAGPSLARLRTLVAESLDGAREVTYDGARRVTLVFVSGLLVGLLDAR